MGKPVLRRLVNKEVLDEADPTALARLHPVVQQLVVEARFAAR